MGFPAVDVNWVAILGAGIVSMILGFIWYGPLFGKQWMKLTGLTKKDAEKAKKKGMGKTMLAGFIATLVTAFVLVHILVLAGSNTFGDGVMTGFWIWLGFFAPVMLGMVLWEGKPVNLYLLNVLYWLVNLAVMGGLLVVWM
jgi:hypothetical protein